MYKALNYWVFGGFDGQKTPYEFIDFAKAQNLDGVELTVGDALDINISQDECKAIRQYADAQGIGLKTLASGAFWNLSLASVDESVRQQAVAFGKKYLQIAAWLGVEAILVIPGATRVAWEPDLPVFSYRQAWEQSVKSLQELLPVAEVCQVTIALENVWNRFLLSPMEWKFYLDQFQSDRIGMYFDIGNCCLFGRPQDYVEILGSRIKAIHVKNFQENDCAGGLHGFGDDIEVGQVDFPALFQEMARQNLTVPMTAEMVPFCRLPNMVLPDLALAELTVAKLKKLVP